VEIGARSQEEIAISITAELIAVRRRASGARHKRLQRETREAVPSEQVRSR
jgi:xanthine/CO dehydrogenase XdhC/CoxF family maturation factor